MSFRKFRTYAKIGAAVAVWTIVSLGTFEGAGTPFYRVKEQYAVVLKHVGGQKTIDDKVGVHWRINSINPTKWVFTTKSESMRVECIHLDNDPKPHTMQAADNMPFDGEGQWTYQIADLKRYGIELGEEVKAMLTKDLNGVAKDEIQSHPVEYIVTGLDAVSKEVTDSKKVKDTEAKYGLKNLAFRMNHATYPHEMNEKAAKAKLVRIEADAFDYAAGKWASGKNKISAADKQVIRDYIEGSGVQTEEGRIEALRAMKDKNLYEMLKERGNTIYVIPHGKELNMTLPEKG